jgi:hypothetical protein
MSQKQTHPKKEFIIHDYDAKIRRTLGLMEKEFSKENFKLMVKYDSEMVMHALAKATRLKNLQIILNLTRFVGKDWKGERKKDMESMSRTEIFRKFFSYLKVDVRKEEQVLGILCLGIFPYILLDHPIIHSQYVILGYIVLVLGLVIYAIILGLRARPGKEYQDDSTEKLYHLTKRLDPTLTKNPFRVVNKKDFVAATRDNKIIFGRNFLKSLDVEDEKIFVICHELFHFRNKGEFYCIVIMISISSLLVLSVIWSENLQSAILTSSNNLLPIILTNGNILLTIIIGIVLLRLSWTRTRRSIESMADIQGARNADDEEASKNALEERYRIKDTTMFDSHPRLEIRKKNIEKTLR